MSKHLYIAKWDGNKETLNEMIDKVNYYSKSYTLKQSGNLLLVTHLEKSNIITETKYEIGEYIDFNLSN